MSEPTNDTRATKALAALADYQPANEGVETALIDLLTDLRHLCAARGISFAAADDTASQHFHQEIT